MLLLKNLINKNEMCKVKKLVIREIKNMNFMSLNEPKILTDIFPYRVSEVSLEIIERIVDSSS